MKKFFLPAFLFCVASLPAQQSKMLLPTQLTYREALEFGFSNSPILAAAGVGQDIQQTYRLGAADLTTLLDAQRSYREITRAYNRALFDTIRSRYQLEAAVGKALP